MKLLAMIAALAASTATDGSPVCKVASPGLAAQVRIACAAARKTALARVPGAKVESAELEEENGKLVYSFDLRRRRRPGVEELQVDALTGAVVSQQHESPAREASEHRRESKQPK